MSERKVKDAIFAQRDAPRRARVSWLPQPNKPPPSRTRPAGPEHTERPAETPSGQPLHDPPAFTQSAPHSATHEISDVVPAQTPTSPSAQHASAAHPEHPEHPEPPPTMRGFFDALPEIPPPPEPAPITTTAQAAIESFVQAAEALSEIRALRQSRVERDLVELARAIASRVLGRELATDPSMLVALARDGIGALAERENVTVRFAADVPEDLRGQLTDAVSHRAPGCTVTFDPELVSGSCIVESAQGYVDESVGTRLDVVMEQLGFGNGGLE